MLGAASLRMRGADITNLKKNALIGNSRAKREEHSALQDLDLIEEVVLILAINSESVCGTLAVDVDECSADHHVQKFGGRVLAKLAETLCGQNQSIAAFAAAGGEPDNGFCSYGFSGALLRAKRMCFVDDDDAGMPEILWCIDQGIAEVPHPFVARKRFHFVEIADSRSAQFKELMRYKSSRTRISR